MSEELPITEETGEEYLANNPGCPVLRMKEISGKAISVNATLGYVFVVQDRQGNREFVHLNRIPPSDLKIRRPHPQHPMFHKGTNFHTCVVSVDSEETDRK
jgi:hypothetical protein